MDLIHAFARGVKDSRLESQVISDFGHIGKVVQIVENLEHLHGSQQVSLGETSLDTNVRDWVTNLINQYPKVDENLIRYLLQDFTDSMKTRMTSSMSLHIRWRDYYSKVGHNTSYA